MDEDGRKRDRDKVVDQLDNGNIGKLKLNEDDRN